MEAQDLTISICIPAFREAENLVRLLPELRSHLDATRINYDIIIIDSMLPQDSTQEVCKCHGVRYINRVGDDSYGAAVRTAISSFSGDYIVFMDADMSHNPAFLGEFIKVIGQGNDLVVASRFVSGGGTENSVVLRLMSIFLNHVYRFVLKLPVLDVSNSLKGYRRSLVEGLTLHAKNFDIVEELLFLAVRRQNERGVPIKIVEMPMTFQRRYAGHSKRRLVVFIVDYVCLLMRLLRMRYWS